MSTQLRTLCEVLDYLKISIEALDRSDEALAGVFVSQAIDVLEASLASSGTDVVLLERKPNPGIADL